MLIPTWIRSSHSVSGGTELFDKSDFVSGTTLRKVTGRSWYENLMIAPTIKPSIGDSETKSGS